MIIMSDNKELTAIEMNGIKIPEKTINDAYQDIVHPVASEVGKLIKKPVQLVNWIADCAKNYFTGSNENTKKLQDEVQKKIENIPPEQLCDAPPNIAVPAIIANSYTDEDYLRSLYSNLIANSMNKQFTDMAHPSFVEIIKQLSPNEALLLKTSKLLISDVATCEVRYQEVSHYDNYNKWTLHPSNIIRDVNPGITIYKYYIPNISNVPLPKLQIMIENFIRLSLITCPENKILMSKDSYSFFYRDQLSEQLESQYKNSVPTGKQCEIAHIPHYLEPTAFGKMFYNICVK